jgi:hypothetical protein
MGLSRSGHIDPSSKLVELSVSQEGDRNIEVVPCLRREIELSGACSDIITYIRLLLSYTGVLLIAYRNLETLARPNLSATLDLRSNGKKSRRDTVIEVDYVARDSSCYGALLFAWRVQLQAWKRRVVAIILLTFGGDRLRETVP